MFVVHVNLYAHVCAYARAFVRECVCVCGGGVIMCVYVTLCSDCIYLYFCNVLFTIATICIYVFFFFFFFYRLYSVHSNFNNYLL